MVFQIDFVIKIAKADWNRVLCGEHLWYFTFIVSIKIIMIRDVRKFLNENSSRIDEIDESSYMEENIPIEPPELPQRHSSE